MKDPIITGFLDRVLANFFGHGKNGKPRRRGLLDAVLMSVLLYAVYAKTPLGAIVETAFNVARGQESRPSWLASFKGRETDVQVSDAHVADATSATSALPAPIVAAAAKHGVDEEALAALMMSSTCTETSCLIDAPPRVSAVLPALAGRAQLTADEAAQALAAGAKELGLSPAGNPELAMESLWIGPIPVKLAVEQARRSNLAEPTDVEAHADFVTPSARRGPLQGALSVIAVYRLRTLAWPADRRFPITSRFGNRIHPITGLVAFHNGTDIGAPVGTAMLAAHRGGVKRQSRDSVCGNYLILDHGLGIETVYCHLAQASVVEGTRVQRKERVGSIGATGRVTGPHLHYILKVRDQPMDPEQFGESPTRDGGLAIAVPEPIEPAPALPTKPSKPPKPTKARKTLKRAKPSADTAPEPSSAQPTDAGPSGAAALSPEARAALERLSRPAKEAR